jgi:hypothetical protein
MAGRRAGHFISAVRRHREPKFAGFALAGAKEWWMSRLFALGFAVLLAATPALAQQPEIPEALRTACHDDYRKFCATVFPGGGRLRACLTKYGDQISEACRAAIETYAPPR